MESANLAALILSTVFFFIVGLATLLGAERIQQIGVGHYERHPWLRRLNPWYRWMRSRSYVVVLRAQGVVIMLVAVLVGVALLTYRQR